MNNKFTTWDSFEPPEPVPAEDDFWAQGMGGG